MKNLKNVVFYFSASILFITALFPDGIIGATVNMLFKFLFGKTSTSPDLWGFMILIITIAVTIKFLTGTKPEQELIQHSLDKGIAEGTETQNEERS